MAACSIIVLLKGDHDVNTEDPYSECLKTLGIHPVIIPVLLFQFANLEELRACLKREYSGIVFTSQRAVEAVTCAMSVLTDEEREELLSKWRSKLTFVVGEATALTAGKKPVLAWIQLGKNREMLVILFL